MDEPCADTITESDLLAYVDRQLDQRRRARIDNHLALCPTDARRVAADLLVMAGLRLLFGKPLG